MKSGWAIIVLLFFSMRIDAQDLSKFKLYHPDADAKTDIAAAVKEAKQSGKNVLIQIGGNWCTWCARFNEFIINDKSIDSLIHDNFVVYHLNYSKENENKKILASYKFPQRFGFPVFLILNQDGELIHTQNSWYLEAGKGYDKEKTTAFLNDWSPKALNPELYK
jgi:thioredoxin-related protein